ncbi:hypothetical protein CAL29_29910 [Bordetella genomosp. 10]|uniref:Glycosyltransferase RgtA/B/C/D-like domain-containing protein n=1 Tax=Bordetella genomosp. 10 TaxID=1416804 RepID=A0A261S6J8_9BORD|nr:hypothetical protein [Bordetella genomosp. 10]OZI32053.1 hypothetical protein CAL29_29910 [Bordetella genomosp. 10]
MESVGQHGVKGRFRFDLLIWLVFIGLTSLGLIHRYGFHDFIVQSLWAEDGPIFFNGAQTYGVGSFVTPYAGYLHVYARFFALVAGIFPLIAVPYVYFSGWLCAVLLAFWAFKRVVPDSNAGIAGAATAVVGMGMMLSQPHGGETFLTLTNAQWWLAIALALICCHPSRFGARTLPLVAVMSLTGPFSILYAPVAAFVGWREKQWRIASVVLAGAAIQVFFLLTSPRAVGHADGDLHHWTAALLTFLKFGIQKPAVGIAGMAFWVLLLLSLYKTSVNRLMLIVCAVVVYAAGLYSIKNMPSVISPIGNGSRYFVVPYALVIACVALQVQQKKWIAILAAIFLVVPVASQINKRFPQEDRYYEQYAALSKYEPNLTIPLPPVIPGNDWPMDIRNRQVRDASNHSVLPARVDQRTFRVAANVCGGAKGAAVVADAVLPVPGEVAVEWVSAGGQNHSARRSYPAGSDRIQLAFAKEDEPVQVMLTYSAAGAAMEVSNVKLICL